MTKTVVVLGGSLGGMAVTHQLLKYTRPREQDLKVILVSKVLTQQILFSLRHRY
jgi:NADH dehydrogenase FAD-containing subunit